jgi:hypothetical protein
MPCGWSRRMDVRPAWRAACKLLANQQQLGRVPSTRCSSSCFRYGMWLAAHSGLYRATEQERPVSHGVIDRSSSVALAGCRGGGATVRRPSRTSF